MLEDQNLTLRLNIVEFDNQAEFDAEVKLKSSGAVYVRNNGPARLINDTVYDGMCEVQYPDGGIESVFLEDILMSGRSSPFSNSSPRTKGLSPRQPLSPKGLSPRLSPRVSPSMRPKRRMSGSLHTPPSVDGGKIEFLGVAFDDPSRQITTSSLTFSVVACMVGGGVLTMPYAISQMGFVFGGIVLAVSAATNLLTFNLLIDCARQTGRDSFPLLANATMGSCGRHLTTVLVCALCWLALIAYLVLVSDMLVPAIQFATQLTISREIVIIAVGVLITPLCAQKSLSALRYNTYFSVTTFLVVTLIISFRALSVYGPHFVSYIDAAHHQRQVYLEAGYRLFPDNVWDALYAIPVFGVSFLCQFNTLPGHSELYNPTRERIHKVSASAMAVATVLYGCVGGFGYLFAQNATCGNILNNFSSSDTYAMVCRCALGLTLTLNCPLLALPLRDSCYIVFNSFKGCFTTADHADCSSDVETSPIHVYHASMHGKNTFEELDTFVPHDKYYIQQTRDAAALTTRTRILLTLVIIVSVLYMACKVQSVLVLWSILGSTVAFMVAIILPCLFWISISSENATWFQLACVSSIVLIASLLAIVCTILTIERLDGPSCGVSM